MHLARAVGTRWVILSGRREAPAQSGYPSNENLFTDVPCAPCWRKSECEFDRMCMQRIGPADVLSAVDRIEARLGSPLEVTQCRF
jgi:ADP-heptose:LPS heptosyltransferase